VTPDRASNSEAAALSARRSAAAVRAVIMTGVPFPDWPYAPVGLPAIV
jgi:hypothetical protein